MNIDGAVLGYGEYSFSKDLWTSNGDDEVNVSSFNRGDVVGVVHFWHDLNGHTGISSGLFHGIASVRRDGSIYRIHRLMPGQVTADLHEVSRPHHVPISAQVSFAHLPGDDSHTDDVVTL